MPYIVYYVIQRTVRFKTSSDRAETYLIRSAKVAECGHGAKCMFPWGDSSTLVPLREVPKYVHSYILPFNMDKLLSLDGLCTGLR